MERTSTRVRLGGDGAGSIAGSYVLLRSFSWQAKLSPFSFSDLVLAVELEEPTNLLDEVHVCLLRLLVSDEGIEEREEWENDLSMLDSTNWSVFLWEWIHRKRWEWARKHLYRCLREGGSKKEYCLYHPDEKAEILLELCNSMLDIKCVSEEIRAREAACAFSLGEGSLESGILSKWAMLGWERYDEGPDGMLVCVNKHKFEDEDPNYDYCMLCGAGGNIVCCDRCSASYHMKCTGENKVSLTPGDTWICEECRFDGKGESIGLRVKDIGPDAQGRHCWMCHGILFSSDPTTGHLKYFEGQEARDLVEELETLNCRKESTKRRPLELNCSMRTAFNVAKRSIEPYPTPASGIRGPGGYLNKYRFGWQAQSTLLHSWRKSRRAGEPDYGLPFPQSTFRWPTYATKGTQFEKCGKCTSCLVPTLHKPCLKYTIGGTGPRDLDENKGPEMDRKCGGHISAIIAYMLKTERDIWGLLQNQWHRDHAWRREWCSKVSRCTSAAEIKHQILQLEEAVPSMLFLEGWFSKAEFVERSKSHSHSLQKVCASSQASGNTVIEHSVFDPSPGEVPDIYVSKTERKTHKYRLPARLLKQARRQGGRKYLLGLDYSQHSKHATVSKRVGFCARVYVASTSGELSYAIRLLDAHINWESLKRPTQGFVGKILKERCGSFGLEYLIHPPDPHRKLIGSEKKGQPEDVGTKDENGSEILSMNKELQGPTQQPSQPVWVSAGDVPLYLLKTYFERQRRIRFTLEGKDMQVSPQKDKSPALKKGARNGTAGRANVKVTKPKFYCLCKTTEVDDSPMVMCDYCSDWFHPECIGMTWDEVELLDRYKCLHCVKKHKNLPAQDPTSPPPCAVCGTPCECGSTGDECQLCGVVLHHSCKFDAFSDGVDKDSKSLSEAKASRTRWKCEACKSGLGLKSRGCLLCSKVGGALKQCTTGDWVHTVCALWIPEVFINISGKVEGLEKIPKRRFELTCTVCKQKCGAVIQCGHPSCGSPLHAQCAREAGLPMTFKVKDEYLQCTAYCKRHADLHGGQIFSVSPQPKKKRPVVKDRGQDKITKKDTKYEAFLDPVLASKCLKEIKRIMSSSPARWFCEPVDAMKLGLYDYNNIIKRPMDLGTICTKLGKNGSVKPCISVKELLRDVRLVFDNCRLYNEEDSVIWRDCNSTEQMILSSFQRLGLCGEDWLPLGAPRPAKTTLNSLTVKKDKGSAVTLMPKADKRKGMLSPEDLRPLLKILHMFLKSDVATRFRLGKSSACPSKDKENRRLLDVKRLITEQARGVKVHYKTVDAITVDVMNALQDLKASVDGRSKQGKDAKELVLKFTRAWELAIGGLDKETHAGANNKKKQKKQSDAQNYVGVAGKNLPDLNSQLKDALQVIDEVLRMKRAEPFALPVQAKKLGLVDYDKIVKRPMDLGTIKTKIRGQIKDGKKRYCTADDIYCDVCLVWSNCKLYNLEGSPIYTDCLFVQKTFEKRWLQKGLPIVPLPVTRP